MDSARWDARYADAELRWEPSVDPWVREWTHGLPPGRLLDIAGGEGRDAVWLVERGWTALTVDFSDVATRRARALADARLGRRALGRFEARTLDVVAWAKARPPSRRHDAGTPSPTPTAPTPPSPSAPSPSTPATNPVNTPWADLVPAADVVLVCYLHLPRSDRRTVLGAAARQVAAGGRLIVVGYDPANLTRGVDGAVSTSGIPRVGTACGPRDPRLLYSPSEVVVDIAGSGLGVLAGGTYRCTAGFFVSVVVADRPSV